MLRRRRSAALGAEMNETLKSELIMILISGSLVRVIMTFLGVPCRAWAPYAVAILPLIAQALPIPIILYVIIIALPVLSPYITKAFLPDVYNELCSTILFIKGESDLTPTLLGGTYASILMAVLVYGIILHLIDKRTGKLFIIPAVLAILAICYTMKSDMSLYLALPALVGLLLIPTYKGASWKMIVPCLLIVALAVLMLPEKVPVWEELQDKLSSFSGILDDYFRFTEERVAFSLNAEGYDHAVSGADDTVETRLGGPADPSDEIELWVETDRDLLLRGTIRRDYTGNSWTDTAIKSRYLYYDISRDSLREKLFGFNSSETLFDMCSVSVTAAKEATSTLFITCRVSSVDMSLTNALYYNSLGELFLSRSVEEGDSYAFGAYIPRDGETFRQAVIDGMGAGNAVYTEAKEECLSLPDGIDSGLYTLTQEITQNCTNPYDIILAIQNWLYHNCTYTLDVDYPNDDRDFVSQFVLETRKGYCSYYASALAVMGRIAGVPTRYIEGYYVSANGGTVAVTGENAHAWVEVCFDNIGWVAFDPTSGGDGGNQDTGSEDDSENNSENGADNSSEENNQTEPSPEPTQEPDDEPENEPESEPENEPNDEPETDETQVNEPTATPVPLSFDNTPNDGDKSHWLMWLIVILLLLLILLIWLIVRRLRATDPMRLCGGEKGAAVLYRSMLTLLAVAGLSPKPDEPPTAFAKRVGRQSYAAFVEAFARQVYSGEITDDNLVKKGKAAYAVLYRDLTQRQKLRYNIHRLLKGLGDFDTIP